MLFSSLQLRSVRLPNRILISPMSQYSAEEGMASDWHLVNIGRFAIGGAGTVMVEATAVTRDGRGTLGDLGLWSDDHVEPLARLARFLESNGSVAAIQLQHAGSKSGKQRPWEGNLSLPEAFERGTPGAWPPRSATAEPWAPGGAPCIPLSAEELPGLARAWGDAAARAARAGFRICEIHAAHGYLLNGFLSPHVNNRADGFGGDLAGRMRFPLMVVEAVRNAWPDNLPLFIRISATDWTESGWSVDDSVVFARELKARGVDLVDCSSGGAMTTKVPNDLGFQVHLAQRVREDADIATMAVGHIIDEEQAEAIIAEGRADLVAIGRQALISPNWALHAKARLQPDNPFEAWHPTAGWWLARRKIGYPEGRTPESPALGL